MHLNWNPNVDPETEDRLVFMKMSDAEKWKSFNKLILMNRKEPLTFHKRRIEWK
ncbi:hypothetical protein MATR_26730 [Marivirga tractuosa]|uniref:Uncharacterized protein n=2 Tax=Marivirga TaxID=869806 RepID=E4TN86_MARTH|nr:hypothetical protein Ftrac_3503 [Marivirga tractuosa DSM 4126]BDD15848.1 hypothetical protein MATR_26730 [Marivirga tractuosa]